MHAPKHLVLGLSNQVLISYTMDSMLTTHMPTELLNHSASKVGFIIISVSEDIILDNPYLFFSSNQFVGYLQSCQYS